MSFPDNEIGRFAAAWFESVNSGETGTLENYGIFKDGWDAYHASMIALAQKNEGLTPYLVSYFTDQTIEIYAKENLGGYVRVVLSYDADQNSIYTMSIKKSFEAKDYPLQYGLEEKHVIALVEKIAEELKSNYVYKNDGKKIADGLLARIDTYKKIAQGDLLARTLTKDLVEISNDKHLQVIPPSLESEVNARFRAEDVSEKVSDQPSIELNLLDGNIGYLKIERFTDNDLFASKASEIQKSLGNAKAIVIDLRQSGGGDGKAVSNMIAYLINDTIVLNDGQKILAKNSVANRARPIYILTSNRSKSAAEAMAYYAKSFGFAKVVGERTAGAGYLVDVFDLPHTFFLVNSTRTSFDKGEGWQGKGVEPDMPVNASEALEIVIKEVNNRF
ncbi:S41 family peptidase [Muricauda sp. NFXS6]|uniref:S41 family peptidase n=1 Tax=Allomuricauda sp. NFXS6 TaxID=2819094 RepID=UPI0032DFEE7C